MDRGNKYPDENRDRLKNTNNMWSYPEPEPIAANPDAPATTETGKNDDKAEAEGK